MSGRELQQVGAWEERQVRCWQRLRRQGTSSGWKSLKEGSGGRGRGGQWSPLPRVGILTPKMGGSTECSN